MDRLIKIIVSDDNFGVSSGCVISEDAFLNSTVRGYHVPISEIAIKGCLAELDSMVTGEDSKFEISKDIDINIVRL